MSKFRTPYTDRVRVAITFDFKVEPSMTKQSHTDECDINNIMAKYQKTGLIDHVNRFQGDYADLSAMGDFQESLETVRLAEEAFMSLPSSIRAQFENSPAKFVNFVDDPKNQDALYDLGLATRPEPAKTLPDTREGNDLSLPPENKKDAS